jgi:hypothetical protein
MRRLGRQPDVPSHGSCECRPACRARPAAPQTRGRDPPMTARPRRGGLGLTTARALRTITEHRHPLSRRPFRGDAAALTSLPKLRTRRSAAGHSSRCYSAWKQECSTGPTTLSSWTTTRRPRSDRSAAACVWRSRRPSAVSRADQKLRADDPNAGLEAAWKHQIEGDHRRQSSITARIACNQGKRRNTEGDGSSLLAHGMQEVVGSSPTSSTLTKPPLTRAFLVDRER